MKKIDLTSQFVFYLAIILIGVIGGMNYWFYHDHTTNMAKSTENKVTEKMDFLESSIGYFIDHFEYELITKLGNKVLLADHDIVSLTIKDSVGTVLFKEGGSTQNNVKSYSREILTNGESTGVINLSLDMSRVIADREKTLLLTVGLMILSVSLIGGMIYQFYHKKIMHEFDRFHHEQLELTQLAYHDHLTSLPNRILFNDRFQESFKQARRHASLFSVLFVDLDHFKLINDEYGHEAGDVVLKIISQRMLSAVRETDTVARLGGDEFGILLLEVKSKENACYLAEKLLEVISDPIPYRDGLLNIGASIGVALYEEKVRDAKELLNMADTAMYQTKEAGRNNYCCYEKKHDLQE